MNIDQLQTLRSIQREVGDWSLENFGIQKSKATGDNLDSLAPLLGITEELGEWVESTNDDEKKDALADILIYACDFASRENCHLGYVVEGWDFTDDFKEIPFTGWGNGSLSWSSYLVVSIGRLNHVVLKRHQGIRGMEKDDNYAAARDSALAHTIITVDALCRGDHNTTATDILSETWNEIVKKRNWKKNKGDGQC
jgi:hypothetical protein